MSFIGRAEKEVEEILTRVLLPDLIRTQVPLEQIINQSEWQTLNEEVQKHKFDLLVLRKDKPDIIVEINYKHKEKAAKKWREIFDPMLKKYGYDTLLIHDYECNYLFKPQDYNKHILSWNDMIDIINALKSQKIEFN